MSPFSPSERAALDRVTVPAMRAGLAGDIVAAARSGEAPPRRSLRGGWRRHGRVLLGAGALVIASATAAATGLLGHLPIRIPGIIRVAEAPAPKPHHVVRTEKPRPEVGKPVALAAVAPLADPTPLPPTPQQRWRERRAARIAAGLPVRAPLIQRAISAKIRALPPEQRPAAIAEWRRIKALPPAERRLAVARVRAEFLAQHPKMAARYEARLEAKSAAAADGRTPPAALPQAGPSLPLTPDQRAQRREAMRVWRMERRAQRLRDATPRREGSPPPER